MSAVPNGASPGFGALIAQKGGGIASYTDIAGVASVAPGLVLGLATLASIAGSSDVTAIGNQIASIMLLVASTSDVSVTVRAALNAAATIAASGDLAGTLRAIGYVESLCAGSASISLAPYARGNMSAVIDPLAGTITNQSVAKAVWGEALEGTYTAVEVMRLLASVAAGKTIIVDNGGGSATVAFRDLNDTETRVLAEMTGSQRTSVAKDLV